MSLAYFCLTAGIPCKAPSKSKFSSGDRNSRVCLLRSRSRSRGKLYAACIPTCILSPMFIHRFMVETIDQSCQGSKRVGSCIPAVPTSRLIVELLIIESCSSSSQNRSHTVTAIFHIKDHNAATPTIQLVDGVELNHSFHRCLGALLRSPILCLLQEISC